MRKEEKHILISALPGLLFVLLMWGSHITSHFLKVPFYTWGIYPRTIEGLKGILFSPFIHGDWGHLAANTFPILILFTFLYYYYSKIAFEATFWIYFLSGLWAWCLGRTSYHVGASGVIYGVAFLIFFLGIILKNRGSIAMSLIIVSLYGGLFWGLFPLLRNVSWEAHVAGALAGLLLAFYFKKQFPKPVIKTAEPEEEYEYEYWKVDEYGNPMNPPPTKEPEKPEVIINYIYIPKPPDSPTPEETKKS